MKNRASASDGSQEYTLFNTPYNPDNLNSNLNVDSDKFNFQSDGVRIAHRWNAR